MLNENFEKLIKQTQSPDGIHKKQFVLFLGSGCNGACGVQWEQLVKNLLEDTLKQRILNKNDYQNLCEEIGREFDTYWIGSLIKELSGENRFKALIRENIYKKFNIDDFKIYCNKQIAKTRKLIRFEFDEKFSTLFLSALLCVLGHTRAVVTYNYDSILETAISYIAELCEEDIIPNSQHGEEDSQPMALCNQLPIYHVHGFLSHPKSFIKNDSANILLSRDEYISTFIDFKSWETSIQAHLLRKYTCVYIGVSLTDWNMLRLLQTSYNDRSRGFYHYCFTNEKENILIDRLKTTVWESFGVKPIFSGDTYKKYAENLFLLIKTLQNNKKGDKKWELQ